MTRAHRVLASEQMLKSSTAALVAMVIALVITGVAVQVGAWWGRRARKRGGEDVSVGTGTVEGAILGLLGLILTFNLFNAEERFDERRKLVVDAVNAIATTYERAPLLPEPQRSEVQGLLHAYVAAVVKSTATDKDPEHLDNPWRVRAVQLYKQVLRDVEVGCETGQASCAEVLLPAVSMIADTAVARLMTTQAHSPWAVLLLIFTLSTLGAMLAGYSLAARASTRPMHKLIYVLALAATLYVIVDIEFPRTGFVQITELRETAFAALRMRMT